jgi:hypothetical protein
VRLTNAWPAQEGQHGVLNVRVRGTRVHAPLLERLLEIPMDISEGEVVDGELRVVADDAASWEFPRVYGKLVVRGEQPAGWAAGDVLSVRDRARGKEQTRDGEIKCMGSRGWGAAGGQHALAAVGCGHRHLEPGYGLLSLWSLLTCCM